MFFLALTFLAVVWPLTCYLAGYHDGRRSR